MGKRLGPCGCIQSGPDSAGLFPGGAERLGQASRIAMWCRHRTPYHPEGGVGGWVRDDGEVFVAGDAEPLELPLVAGKLLDPQVALASLMSRDASRSQKGDASTSTATYGSETEKNASCGGSSAFV